jgi:hypothetical protein
LHAGDPFFGDAGELKAEFFLVVFEAFSEKEELFFEVLVVLLVLKRLFFILVDFLVEIFSRVLVAGHF